MKRILFIFAIIFTLVSCTQTIPVESIQVSPSKIRLEVGDSKELTCTISPADATNKEVQWTSGIPSVATVSNGLVVAVSPGLTPVYVISLENNGKLSGCEVTVIEKHYEIQSVSLDKSDITVRMGDSVAVNLILQPKESFREELAIRWGTRDSGEYDEHEQSYDYRFAGVEGSGLKKFVRGQRLGHSKVVVSIYDPWFGTSHAAECPVTILSKIPEPIDLGLSVYWGSNDIGKNSPTEGRDYFVRDNDGVFSWGIVDYDNTLSYPYMTTTGDDWVTPIEVNYTDIGNPIVGTQYDVAHIQLGDNWRMPSAKEFQELIDNCSWERVMVNGVKMYRVVGPNGNYIHFRPSSYYWSSELFNTKDQSNAAALFTGVEGDFSFTNMVTEYPSVVPAKREFKEYVRPVKDK